MVYLKQFIIKLKTTYVYKSLLGNYILLALLLSCFILVNQSVLFVVFGLVILFLLFKKERILAIILVMCISVYVLSLQNYNDRSLKSFDTVQGVVIEHDVYPEYQRIVIRSGLNKILGYYNGHEVIALGSKVQVHGSIITMYGTRVPFGYNEKEQLHAKGITHKFMVDEVEILSATWSIFVIRQKVFVYIETKFSQDVSNFIQAMLLGKSYLLEDEMKQALSRSGIMHLFAVSGLHIQLFVLMFHKGLEKIKVKESQTERIISIFLVLYMIVTSFSASIVRASSMYFTHLIAKKCNLKWSGLDVISIVFILWVCINPYAVYSIGFLLSFTSATIIMLFQSYTSHLKEYKQIFMISSILLIVGFPLVSQFQGSINLFTPLYNVVFIPIVSKIILPFTIVVILLPNVAQLLQIVIRIFVEFLVQLDGLFYVSIPFKRLNGVELFLYYALGGLLLLQFSNKRIKKSIIVFMSILVGYFTIYPQFTVIGEVTFLDLDNGEATVIRAPNNGCNVVIDTGDGKNEIVTKYLQSQNIRHINYLVLTHRHLDHNGELRHLVENHKIENIVTHYFDSTDYLTNTIRLREGDFFSCGNINFKVLGPNTNSSDENDNSLVLFAKIGPFNFLFLGDVTKEQEERIALKYDIKVDVVKISHHGSKTSTSVELLDKYQPSYAIIMTGRVKKFGFPHQEVITSLDLRQITTYRTDEMYSIRYRYFGEKKYWFETLNNIYKNS